MKIHKLFTNMKNIGSRSDLLGVICHVLALNLNINCQFVFSVTILSCQAINPMHFKCSVV